MVDESKLSPAQKQALLERNFAKAAIKVALQSYSKKEQQPAPEQLQQYWQSLDSQGWVKHLELFEKYVRTYDQVAVKQIWYDLGHYIADCQRVIPEFNRSRAEILLMIAIGRLSPQEFVKHVAEVATNRERLDRDIQKKIKTLNWQDQEDLKKLDELTAKLDDPKIKQAEVQRIDNRISQIDRSIKQRKKSRDELAIKLVEWKARGNIDITGGNSGVKFEA